MPQSYLDSELYIPAPDRARFSWAGNEYEGPVDLQPNRLLELFALESDAGGYGRELFEGVFPPYSELREGLHHAIREAQSAKTRLRLRLHLSPDLSDRIHALYWELLTDPTHRLALSRSPDTAFSRYSAVPRPLAAPITGRPRLLCVISAPSDIARFRMAPIDRGDVRRQIETSLSNLEMELTILDPPATPGRIREHLAAGDFHLLHLFGHGMIQSHGVSAVVLEDESGRVRFVEEEVLAEIFLGERELRLITLIACHGGALSTSDTFSGLAGRLVQRGLPAVIAMRRAVSVDNAHVFTDHLYRQLAHTGRVDAAVNEARQQLYLAEPQGIGWSSPMLYQRLSEGQLWLSAAVKTEAAEERQATGISVAVRLPQSRLLFLSWMPVFLWLTTAIPGFWPADEKIRFERLAWQLSIQVTKAYIAFRQSAVEKIEVLRLDPLSESGPETSNASETFKEDAQKNITTQPASSVPSQTSQQTEFNFRMVPREQTLRYDVESAGSILDKRFENASRIEDAQDDSATKSSFPEHLTIEPMPKDDQGSATVVEPNTTYGLALSIRKSNLEELDRAVLEVVIDAFIASNRFRLLDPTEINQSLSAGELIDLFDGRVNRNLADLPGLDLAGLVDYSIRPAPLESGAAETVWTIEVRLIDAKTSSLLTAFSVDLPAPPLEATEAREAVRRLLNSIRRIFTPWGYVTQVHRDRTVIVDLGPQSKLHTGDVLELVQEGEPVIHPVTGQEIHPPISIKGELKVISEGLRSPRCRPSTDEIEVKVGDRVRVKPPQPRLPI